MYKPESVLENEIHKILWDFKIQIDHLIPTRRQDLVIVNKTKNLPNSRHIHPGKLQTENQRKWKERQVLKPCQRVKKKLWNIKATVIPVVIGAHWMIPKSLIRGWRSWKLDEPRPSKLQHCWNLRSVLEIWGDLLSLRLSENSWLNKNTFTAVTKLVYLPHSHILNFAWNSKLPHTYRYIHTHINVSKDCYIITLSVNNEHMYTQIFSNKITLTFT